MTGATRPLIRGRFGGAPDERASQVSGSKREERQASPARLRRTGSRDRSRGGTTPTRRPATTTLRRGGRGSQRFLGPGRTPVVLATSAVPARAHSGRVRRRCWTLHCWYTIRPEQQVRQVATARTTMRLKVADQLRPSRDGDGDDGPSVQLRDNRGAHRHRSTDARGRGNAAHLQVPAVAQWADCFGTKRSAVCHQPDLLMKPVYVVVESPHGLEPPRPQGATRPSPGTWQQVLAAAR
jgi:hypothetical protein